MSDGGTGFAEWAVDLRTGDDFAMAQDQGHLLGQRYRLMSVVGRGGMGTVWRAHDEVLGRDVAVKEVLYPAGLSAADERILYERTFREARASARLNHPGVVTVHDVVEEYGRPWIVMEFVRARSLQHIIDEDGPLPPARAADLGHQTLSALRHAHAAGVLHRDVKPSNVLITADGRVVLTDFGIAQAEGDTTLTQTGLVMGSPNYIPPERAQGERAVPASDLWALGATLYAAVEGGPPYEREDAVAALAAALSEPVPPPRNAGPLRPVLDGLLTRDPTYRITADQALPMLRAVVRAGAGPRSEERRPARPAPVPPVPATPAPAPRDAAPPSDDDTVLDPPPGGSGASDRTVLDASVFEAATHLDRTEHTPPPIQPPAPPYADAQTLVERDWVPPEPAHWHEAPTRPPASSRRRRRTKTTVIVVIAVILVVAALIAGSLILRHKLTSTGRTAGNETSLSRGATGGSTNTGTAPGGYDTANESGFSVTVPAGWTRRTAGKSVFWDSPGRTTFVQIDQTAWTGTPLQEA
jgi:serine/threonine protein kinase